MDGFFDISKEKTKKKANLKKIGGCSSCGAYLQCKNGQQGVVGHGDKKILIIDGKLSRTEEENGRPLSNIPSLYLRDTLADIGIDLDRDCWRVNSVRCHAENPSAKMVSSCRVLLDQTIKELKPEKIMLLGEEAVRGFLGERAEHSRLKIDNGEKFFGMIAPDQDYDCMVMATYHPSFVTESLLRKKNTLKSFNRYRARDGQKLWEVKQLQKDAGYRIRSLYYKKFLKTLTSSKRFHKSELIRQCAWVPKVEDAIWILRQMLKEPTVGMDYETTALQPYGDDSEIYTVSVSNGDLAWAFPMFTDNKKFMRTFKKLMTSQEINTIIANFQFEDTWTKEKLGFHITNCGHDTMLAAHMLNPTIKGGTGLKLHGYIYEGVIGYDADTHEYLKGRVDKNPYSLNRIKELPIEEVGLYNAMDSLLTVKTYREQHGEFLRDKKLTSAFKLYMEGQRVFSKMSRRGFTVNMNTLIKNERILEKKIVEAEYNIYHCEEMKKWNEHYPDRDFNMKSGDHISKMFFEILGFSTDKKTDSDEMATDKDVLDELSKLSDLAKHILTYKKLYKMLNTDLKGIRNHTCKGKLHPFYGLANAGTGRSSSKDPNFQNLNNTDPFAIEMVRGPLEASDGNAIVMMDYSALEVKGGLAHHHDPSMMAELQDSSIDAHTLMAERMFVKDLKECATFCLTEKTGKEDHTEDEIKHFIKDELRKPIKNISFALAYGGSAKRIYITAWDENWKSYHKAWFHHIGIDTDAKFMDHCKGLFEYYWERYKVFGEWREKIWEEYLTNGYLHNKMGFRINGVNSKTFITNSLIQGASYAVCLLANIKLDEVLEDKGYESALVCEIHDSLEITYTPEEMFNGDLMKEIKYCMEDYINNKVRWLTLPMTVDGEWFLGNWSDEVEEEEVRNKYKETA